VILQILTLFSPNSTSPTFSLQAIDLDLSTQGISLMEAPQLDSALGIDTDIIQVLNSVWWNSTLWVVFTIYPTSGVHKVKPQCTGSAVTPPEEM
jgi:hypothetical protein